MRQLAKWIKSALVLTGYALLLFVGAVLSVLLARPLMVLVVIAAVAAAFASAFSPRFNEWFEKLGEPQVRLREARH